MFTMSNEQTMNPIKVWLEDESQLEEGCLEQALHLANLPFIHKWVALMPDTHKGMGMPIGGVIATTGVIIPNAVGVDIGCGMNFISTNIPVQLLTETQTKNGNLIQGIVGEILRNVPVGFSHHKLARPCYTMDHAMEELHLYEHQPEMLGLLEAGPFQVGTLGGGNHFIELQQDDNGMLAVMLHSGSRNIGKQVCDYFHNAAREENARWKSSVPDQWRLAFLPTDTQLGQDYIHWMNLALDFAYENRAKMMLAIKAILDKWITGTTGMGIEYGQEVNCHHNYAALEHHYGKNVWVHRKGATRARKGELAVIPGAMGSYSYLVEGLGNEASFQSSSHGAGRQYSRKGAMQAFSCEEVMLDLKSKNIVLGKRSKQDIAEESRFAYKDIDQVMACQRDLVAPIKRLQTIGVVKG